MTAIEDERGLIRCSMHGCSEVIDPDRDYRRVVGWEKRRGAGGTNTIALRQPQEQWACMFCIDKMKRGLASSQDRMF